MVKSQKGQASVEAILILVLILMTAILVTREARNQGWLASFISTPWTYMDGMIQYGVWAPPNAAQNQVAHRSPRRVSRQVQN